MLVLGIVDELGEVELANKVLLLDGRVAKGKKHLLAELDLVSQLTHNDGLLELARALVCFPHLLQVETVRLKLLACCLASRPYVLLPILGLVVDPLIGGSGGSFTS